MKKLLLILLLVSSVQSAPYDYYLSFTTSGGADSVRARWGANGGVFTDSLSVTSFPTYDTLAFDDSNFYRFQYLWFIGNDTSVSEGIALSLDSSSTSSYSYLLSFPVGSNYDSVRAQALRNGQGAVSTVSITSFPSASTIQLNAGNYYTLRYTWFIGTDTFITEGYAPPLIGTLGGTFPDPGANLCTVYGFVGSVGMDARVKQNNIVNFSLSQKVNDTCNNVILTNFTKTVRTDVDGRFEADLLRSSCLGGAEYNVRIVYKDGSTVTHAFSVPDSTSYQLIW